MLFLPDAPSYLARKGQIGKAKKTLSWLYDLNEENTW